jgi:hypothetical protein
LARKVDGSRQRPAIVKGKRLVLSKFVIGFSPLLIRPVKFAGSWQRPAPVPGKNWRFDLISGIVNRSLLGTADSKVTV